MTAATPPVARTPSPGTRSTLLIAYDIRDPVRLERVHRRTIRTGLRLHYSVYVADLTDRERDALLADLARLIDARVDDVRLYRVPEPPRGAWAGPLPAGDDLLLLGSPAALLAERLAGGRP